MQSSWEEEEVVVERVYIKCHLEPKKKKKKQATYKEMKSKVMHY